MPINNRSHQAYTLVPLHTSRWLAFILLLLSAPAVLSMSANGLLHHDITVQIKPTSGELIVKDRITLNTPATEIAFLLNAELTVALQETVGTLTAGKRLQGSVPVRQYRITLPHPSDHFTLTYQGTIAHALNETGERSSLRQSTPGKISDQGVFLSGTSYWYPQFDNDLINFRMQVELPDGWQSVSQGKAHSDHSGWEALQPQEEIYLIAAPYFRFQLAQSGRLAEVYLRENNSRLATPYLEATHRYISLYEKLLGPYPYSKFSLVENFWESGYGMPSFTLLGPRVIQLPFIIHTSYPHEILHNWWGNGVYADITSGNWSEGLTTYLADHLLKEQQGEGANYRRNSLKNYASYVTEQDDFPLSKFRGNQGPVSQSIGYGKTLMLFHMLRQELGDELFVAGLRSLYHNYKFRHAGFNEIQSEFETLSGKPLTQFFNQWLTRKGAPELKLNLVASQSSNSGHTLTVSLEQIQSEDPFNLRIPLFISGEGDNKSEWHFLEMAERKKTWTIDTTLTPVRVAVDPLFDLFRRLDNSEVPSSLGQIFGAKKVFAILPHDEDDTVKQAYQTLVRQWQQRQPGLTLLWDNEITALPKQEHVWIFGKSNQYASQMLQYVDQDIIASNTGTSAITIRNPSQPNQTFGYIESDTVGALKGLSRKLPHYGKYSYALFNGNEPRITKHGEWRVDNNAMSWILNSDYSGTTGELAEHPPLIMPE